MPGTVPHLAPGRGQGDPVPLPPGEGRVRALPQTPDRVLEELYCRMDALVGRTVAACDRDRSVLMIISDHGFNSFRRGVDLNRWLEIGGYLKVNEPRRAEKAPGRDRWVADAGLRRRPGRHLPESQGTAVAGHRRAGGGSRRLVPGNRRRSSAALADPENRPAGRQDAFIWRRRSTAGRTRTPRRT